VTFSDGPWAVLVVALETRAANHDTTDMDTELLNQRIEQWEKMTREAPDGMSWFSLGGAYKDAERYEEAAHALRKAIEYDEQLSRAYQLLGQVLIQSGAEDEAATILTHGYVTAAEHGDIMPMRAMGSLLEKLGRTVPQVAGTPEPAEVGEGEVLDRRSGQPGPRLPEPPFRGPLGRYIVDHYSAPTWREWIGQGTKVINELRLDFSNEEHQEVYEVQMMAWLGFTKDDVDRYAAEIGENDANPKS